MKVLNKEETLERIANSLTLKTEFVGETDEYAKNVNRLIREEYSLSNELAIIRKTLAKLINNENDFTEFIAYNEKVNEIKEKAKENDIDLG